jgi:hypothetical protein
MLVMTQNTAHLCCFLPSLLRPLYFAIVFLTDETITLKICPAKCFLAASKPT